MKNKFTPLLVVLCIAMGCTEEVKSPGEKMTDLMSKLVEERNVQKAWAYQLTQTGYSVVESDSDFQLDENYILFLPGPSSVVTRYYNADKVIRFEIYEGTLYIYFS